MFRKIFILAAGIGFIFCFSIANISYSEVAGKTAMQQQWVNIFPIGTKIYDLAIDPQNENTIYTSTYKGLFKSIDNGKLWMPIKIFAPKWELSWGIVKIVPMLPKVLFWGLSWEREGFLGERGGRIWKSKDGGESWEDISAGVINDKVYAIAIHPKSPEIIYVASEGGLYKTFNGGKTWGRIAGTAYSVFLNPDSPDEVYATVQGGLHRSTDGGQSFDLIEPTYTYIAKDFLGKKRGKKIALLFMQY